MDDEQPQTASSGSLSIVRAAGVIILFVLAVAILVSVGTRPSVSSTPTTTTPTTAAATGATTTTVAGGAVAPTTTTTVAHTTTTKAGHGGKATTTTTAAPSATTVVVANGTSTNGLAAHYSTVIGAGGWTMKTPIDAATSVPTSAVYYAAGQQQQAGSIATTIGVKPAQVLPITTSTPVTGATGVDVVVVIGADLASTTTATT